MKTKPNSIHDFIYNLKIDFYHFKIKLVHFSTLSVSKII